MSDTIVKIRNKDNSEQVYPETVSAAISDFTSKTTNILTSNLANVAFSGKYADLKEIPNLDDTKVKYTDSSVAVNTEMRARNYGKLDVNANEIVLNVTNSSAPSSEVESGMLISHQTDVTLICANGTNTNKIEITPYGTQITTEHFEAEADYVSLAADDIEITADTFKVPRTFKLQCYDDFGTDTRPVTININNALTMNATNTCVAIEPEHLYVRTPEINLGYNSTINATNMSIISDASSAIQFNSDRIELATHRTEGTVDIIASEIVFNTSNESENVISMYTANEDLGSDSEFVKVNSDARVQLSGKTLALDAYMPICVNASNNYLSEEEVSSYQIKPFFGHVTDDPYFKEYDESGEITDRAPLIPSLIKSTNTTGYYPEYEDSKLLTQAYAYKYVEEEGHMTAELYSMYDELAHTEYLLNTSESPWFNYNYSASCNNLMQKLQRISHNLTVEVADDLFVLAENVTAETFEQNKYYTVRNAATSPKAYSLAVTFEEGITYYTKDYSKLSLMDIDLTDTEKNGVYSMLAGYCSDGEVGQFLLDLLSRNITLKVNIGGNNRYTKEPTDTGYTTGHTYTTGQTTLSCTRYQLITTPTVGYGYDPAGNCELVSEIELLALYFDYSPKSIAYALYGLDEDYSMFGADARKDMLSIAKKQLLNDTQTKTMVLLIPCNDIGTKNFEGAQ